MNVTNSSRNQATCVMPLRAFSPLDDPTATYVPHNPTAGLTAVGIKKDMGLFPGWRLLCYSQPKENKIHKKCCKRVKNKSVNTERKKS